MLKKTVIMFLIIIISLPFTNVYAVENNTSSNYTIIIEDDANLLKENEKKELKTKMSELLEFGNVMFKTTSTSNNYSSLRYIQNYYYSKFKNQSGVAFYIDMNNRQICACATGGLDKTLTSAKCDIIMDNVYTYARRGDYFGCAKETFLQMDNLLNGRKIAESMKYISNSILAIMLSLFTSYGIYILLSNNKKASKNDIIEECEVFLEHTPISVEKTGTHREYSPISDSSSSGGSFGGGRTEAVADFLEVEEVMVSKIIIYE